MKTKRENIKDEERKDKTGIITSSHAVKIIMLTRTKIQIAPQRYSSSLSFSLPNHYKYLTSLIKKFRDDIHKPLKGFHLLIGFSQTKHFFPKHFLQTWPVSRTHSSELPKLHGNKFDLETTYRNFSIFLVNKLTMLFTGFLNLWSNYFQLGGHDTTQINNQMTKDTTNTSQLGQSSQHTRLDLTRPQKSHSRRRTKHGPKYQLFFILVFLEDMFM